MGKGFLTKLLDAVAPDDGTGDPGEVNTPGPPASDPLAGFDLGTSAPVTPAAPVAPARTSLEWTLDDIFKAGKVEGGRNSAETVLKLMESLNAFPPAQQVAMVRAMDAADDTWDETTVLADAQKRAAILRRYEAFVDGDVKKFNDREVAAYDELRVANEARVADIDLRIKALQDERAAVVSETTSAKATGEEKVRGIQKRAEEVKLNARGVAARYEAVVRFFGGSVTPEAKL